MYRKYIALAVYSNSQATMDYSSEPGVRGAFFRAIPRAINIVIIIGKIKPQKATFFYITVLRAYSSVVN